MNITLENIIAPVNDEMNRFEELMRMFLTCDSPLLENVIEYVFGRKGKRIRPLLAVLSAAATGKQLGDRTFAGAAAVELIHSATIIHDDVVDESDERRGRKSVNASWSSKIAVLVGDYLLSKALLIITDNKLHDMLDIMTRPICEMSEGELMQIERSMNLDLSRKTYFEIIQKKTAVLIAASMSMGAKSVGANNEFADKMYNIGQNIGIAFQIRDDIFDYHKTDKIGKPAGNDVVERKITLPLLHAISLVSQDERNRILKLVENAGENRDNVNLIRDFVNLHHGIEYAEKEANNYCNKAIELIDELPETPAKYALRDMSLYVVQRES
ncbi:MAG: polyprenyl synthetase family protein [Prevotellaceae bacterium]|jgi:octaprenyl-diphosphate synthase|nr:polyprenyl synthetase family protein [Prevotellaceae bacterium]